MNSDQCCISRRKFVQVSATTILAVGSFGALVGCSSGNDTENDQMQNQTNPDKNSLQEKPYEGFNKIKYLFEGTDDFDAQSSVPFLHEIVKFEDTTEIHYVWVIDPIGEKTIELPWPCAPNEGGYTTECYLNSDGSVSEFLDGGVQEATFNAYNDHKEEAEIPMSPPTIYRCSNNDGSLSESFTNTMFAVGTLFDLYEESFHPATEANSNYGVGIESVKNSIDFTLSTVKNVEEYEARLFNALNRFMEEYKQATKELENTSPSFLVSGEREIGKEIEKWVKEHS